VDLLTVGESFEDLICAGLPRLPRLGEELRIRSMTSHPGGGAIITAIAAARLGLRAGVISAVSPTIASRLRAERVALTNLRRPSERGACSVALSTTRDRAFVTFDGVNRVLEPRLIASLRRLSRPPRHVHFALGPRRCKSWIPVINGLRRHGLTTSWDFGWHTRLRSDADLSRLLRAVDCVFVNEIEAALYARAATLDAAIPRWRTLSRLTVIKLGRRGAMIVAEDRVERRPAPVAAVADTTGAGDAFNAGFLAAHLAGGPFSDALRLGNHVGSRSTRHAGGVDGLPRWSQLPVWAKRLLEAV
jgi:sugar/nucleoside kinase (ribokinase family)